jgi:hypothetical protein
VTLSHAQELRDGLNAVLSAQGAYDGIVRLRDSDIDLVGQSLCEPARSRAPLDRREADVLAETMMEVFDLDYEDAVVAVGFVLAIYCPDVI